MEDDGKPVDDGDVSKELEEIRAEDRKGVVRRILNFLHDLFLAGS
jgi:hypothetical protein